jgi:hypothetical protein
MGGMGNGTPLPVVFGVARTPRASEYACPCHPGTGLFGLAGQTPHDPRGRHGAQDPPVVQRTRPGARVDVLVLPATPVPHERPYAPLARRGAGARPRAAPPHDLGVRDHARPRPRARRPQNSVYDMSKILQSVKQSVARRAMIHLRQTAPDWLDRLKVVWPDGRTEHRFWQQGGGYDRNMYGSRAIEASIQYLHANPVRRGLVARPTDWEWSSARWYAGERSVPLTIDPLGSD